MSKTLEGAWSPWNFEISDSARKVFEDAVESIIGVTYSNPFCYAQRSSAEDNFSFLCKAVTADEAGTTNLARVNISSLSGNSQVFQIEFIPPQATNNPGGWSSWRFPATEDENKILEEALDDLIGVEYDSLGATSQVVAGVNYAFFAKGTPVLPPPNDVPFPAIISVTRSAGGQIELGNIKRITPAGME